jgi:hypothetical protein
MTLRDEIAKIIVKHCIRQNIELFPNPMADGILSLLSKRVGMEKVEKCDKCWGIPHTGHVCEKCHGSGELVTVLTLEEAIEVPKMLLNGKAFLYYKDNMLSKVAMFIELPDCSRIRVKE